VGRVRGRDPNVYITNLAPNQNGAWMGLLWQAGGKPFRMAAADQISVNANNEPSKKLASYWGGLVKEGVVSTDPDFTDQWYQALNKGKYATWLTAAWGPVFLSTSAKDTSGKWRAAPLPQWAAGENKSGNWGGSTSAVIKSTKNPIAAAKFAEFLNTDPESAKMMATEQFLFPPTKALLGDAAFAAQKPEFYGGQTVNQVFADVSDTVSADFGWPPFLDQTVKDWDETVGKALADKTDPAAALDQWQQRITTYAEGQGFKVAK
jgi:multiple sugar transport system substrate-binding protein